MESNREFKDTILGFSLNKGHLDKLSKLKFNPLDDELKEALAEIDSTLGECKYYDEEHFCKFKNRFLKNHGKELSLLCFNINGLPKKIEDFEALMGTLQFDFDIIGFTETHLNEVSAKFTTLKDYTNVSNSRKSKHHWGGVAIYLRSDMTYKHRTDMDIFEDGVLESVFVEIIDKGKSFYVGVIYRPPNSDLAKFSSHLNGILQKLKDKTSYLMGDFNLDLMKSEQHAATGKFLGDFNSVGFHPLISLPTRITEKSATLIDNILLTIFVLIFLLV